MVTGNANGNGSGSGNTNVYVEASGRRIVPFDDPSAEVLVVNRPLGEWQQEMFRDARLTVISERVTPCLVIPDNLFTTGAVLGRFVAGAAGGNAVLVLKNSLFGEGTTPVQPNVERIDTGWRFDAIRFDNGGDGPVRDVVIDPEEKEIDLGFPSPLGGDEGPIKIPLARHPVMTLHHWVHILWANQAAGAAEALRPAKWKAALRIAWAIVRAASFNKWRILGKLNTIGRGCDIHPTALIEGSTLGDGVTVGPGARVLFSRVGDGANIMSGAQVEVSTIGAEAVVAQLSTLRLCVLYPKAFAGQSLMQACVLGRNTLTTGGSFSIDLNLDSDIRVPLDGRLWSTSSRVLGAAFGHRCRIGTGFWLASGRAIPNDSLLIREPERVISRVPDSPGDGRPWVNDHGQLVQLG